MGMRRGRNHLFLVMRSLQQNQRIHLKAASSLIVNVIKDVAEQTLELFDAGGGALNVTFFKCEMVLRQAEREL